MMLMSVVTLPSIARTVRNRWSLCVLFLPKTPGVTRRPVGRVGADAGRGKATALAGLNGWIPWSWTNLNPLNDKNISLNFTISMVKTFKFLKACEFVVSFWSPRLPRTDLATPRHPQHLPVDAAAWRWRALNT